MEIFYESSSDIIIDISDIKKENHNKSLQVESPDEFYKKIHPLKIADEANVDEKFKDYFDNDNTTEKLTSYNIKHWVSNRSFGELIDMFENDEIHVPNMQRNFVWDSLKCSRLIESIVLGLPIPPLFLLETRHNTYELIDGYQRLSALTNFVQGRPWNYEENNIRKVPAKLSKKIASEIAGKKFTDLDEEYQRTIRRSTIPLIEFKQLEPDNFDSKYLIFERINTGSVKLNPMQIRKSLAYGKFIEQLYHFSEHHQNLNKIFTAAAIRNDMHVEAVLRTYCMYQIYYKDFQFSQSGIKNILNIFCEKNRDNTLDKNFLLYFDKALEMLLTIFKKEDIFRRVEIDDEGNFYYSGNINISIMEALMGVVINSLMSNKIINPETLARSYLSRMAEITEEGVVQGNNPYTTNTGSKDSILERFDITKEIVEKSYDL